MFYNIKQLKSLAFQHISLCAAIRSLGIFTGPFILAGSSHFTHRIAVATAASTLQLPAAKFGQLGRSDTARTGNNPVARIGLGKMQLPAGSTLCHDRSSQPRPCHTAPCDSNKVWKSVENLKYLCGPAGGIHLPTGASCLLFIKKFHWARGAEE